MDRILPECFLPANRSPQSSSVDGPMGPAIPNVKIPRVDHVERNGQIVNLP